MITVVQVSTPIIAVKCIFSDILKTIIAEFQYLKLLCLTYPMLVGDVHELLFDNQFQLLEH